MELTDIKRNVTAIEGGAWINNIPEMDDLELKVRGKDNADWRRLEAEKYAAVSWAKRVNGRIPQDEMRRVNMELLLEACLLDWRNVTEHGSPVAFSREAAAQILNDPQCEGFADAIVWAASVVARTRATAAEDVAKN